MNKWLYKHTYNIIAVGVMVCVATGLLTYSHYAQEQKQNTINSVSDKIINMSCSDLKQYVEDDYFDRVDHGRDSREAFASAKYYHSYCHVTHGWLASSGGVCEYSYIRFGGDDWTCQKDFYPRDRDQKIIEFPNDWYYIENGERIDDPTYVLGLHKAYGTIYSLGPYKGIINPNLELDIREQYDIYFPEIEYLIKKNSQNNT